VKRINRNADTLTPRPGPIQPFVLTRDIRCIRSRDLDSSRLEDVVLGSTTGSVVWMNAANVVPDLSFGEILTPEEPFGPPDADVLFARSSGTAFELIDRTNLVFSRAAINRPVYLVGRKGSGKTAFLKGTFHDSDIAFEELVSSSVYSKYLGFVRRFQERHAPLFADQLAEVWATLFTHVAIFHVCKTASNTDPVDELQTLWDYHQGATVNDRDATTVVEHLLASMKALSDVMAAGADISELTSGLCSDGVTYLQARSALSCSQSACGDHHGQSGGSSQSAV
jgi:hypothetical protein